jgi:hypothetical protein
MSWGISSQGKAGSVETDVASKFSKLMPGLSGAEAAAATNAESLLITALKAQPTTSYVQVSASCDTNLGQLNVYVNLTPLLNFLD